MIIKWTVECEADFPESKMEEICANIIEHQGAITNDLYNIIHEAICSWEDDLFYAFGEKQYQDVIEEAKKRVGGIQLSMFDYKKEKTNYGFEF